MKIISHRGFWHAPSEKNTKKAFCRSFESGFGTETDVRDRIGNLVISHDLPSGEEISLAALLTLMGEDPKLLAINIKADGLAKLLSKTMLDYCRSNWFAFDMSIPDMRDHLAVGNPVFARMSEVELNPVWLDQVEGIWLDSFDKTWFDLTIIENLIKKGKQVCVVSSELHSRDQYDLWKMLLPMAEVGQLILCTDFPLMAKEYFKVVP